MAERIALSESTFIVGLLRPAGAGPTEIVYHRGKQEKVARHSRIEAARCDRLGPGRRGSLGDG